MAKLIHFTEENSCYFLTSTTYERNPIFINNQYAQILCKIIYNLRKREKMSLLGFVIMPEHFHLLIIPSNGVNISWIMQEIKKGSARLINKNRISRVQGRALVPYKKGFFRNKGTLGRPRPRVNTANRYLESYLIPKKVWMDEYYDYIIRNEEDLMKHLQYINNNPIKRRLVESAEKYLWSSANSNFENDLEKKYRAQGRARLPKYTNLVPKYEHLSQMLTTLVKSSELL